MERGRLEEQKGHESIGKRHGDLLKWKCRGTRGAGKKGGGGVGVRRDKGGIGTWVPGEGIVVIPHRSGCRRSCAWAGMIGFPNDLCFI